MDIPILFLNVDIGIPHTDTCIWNAAVDICDARIQIYVFEIEISIFEIQMSVKLKYSYLYLNKRYDTCI